tara:strand:+ start:2356 stop:2733 length:378 start_codon:yes stop_codon:yes gene_type:complete
MSNRNPNRPPPFSLRLTKKERSILESQANGEPLGSYIRSRLFHSEDSGRHSARVKSAAEEPKELAQILALLGRSNFARNLDDLAGANRCGSLPLWPETESSLLTACDDIAEIKSLLMSALRIKED